MVLDLMIVEDEKKKAQPGKRSLVVHLHEDHPKDRDALTLVERLVEDEVPLTLVFGEENVNNWLTNVDGQMYDRVKILTQAPHVDVAWRRSTQPDRRDPQKEYMFVRGHFKAPSFYCPPDGKINDEVMAIMKALQKQMKKVLIPRTFGAMPYKRKDEQAEIVTVTPLHRRGFGLHKFIHLDQIPEYQQRVEAHCAQGLMPLKNVMRKSR